MYITVHGQKVSEQKETFKKIGTRGKTYSCVRGICDAIWENPPHVAQGNFAEINKIILELLCFSLLFINFDNT